MDTPLVLLDSRPRKEEKDESGKSQKKSEIPEKSGRTKDKRRQSKSGSPPPPLKFPCLPALEFLGKRITGNLQSRPCSRDFILARLPAFWCISETTITHKKITKLIPKQFRFGNSSTEITGNNSQKHFGQVDRGIR